ncbi:MAG: GDSL-type esterase/lipase family protein [Puia sp.]
MKKILSACLVASAILLLSFLPIKKIKVIFFGDSITQMGVQANGYVTLTNGLLNPGGNGNYDVSGAGIGGNKVYDLYLRMDDDVISKSPDIVVIWVGVNDVWHKKMGTGTDADKFERFYLAIIKKLKEAHAKVIICTPSTIGEKNDYSNEQDGDLNKYSNIIRKIAAEEQVGLIDLRKEFHEYEVDHNTGNLEKGILTLDGVHLNDQGNRFVANLMADAIKKIH